MKRRSLLALGGSLTIAGCLGSRREGEGTTVEIIPSNRTEQEVTLAVSVYGTDGSLLLDHTYSLPAGHSDESNGVEDRVDYLVVSLGDREPVRHEYAPDVEICSREGEDVNIIVTADGISFEYTC